MAGLTRPGWTGGLSSVPTESSELLGGVLVNRRSYGEAVEVVEQRYSFFPRVFRWRGRCYEVESVERCRTVVRQGFRGPVERRYFHVRCAGGVFELYQDLRTGVWHLQRARSQGASVSLVPRILRKGPSAGSGRVLPAWR